MSSAIERLAEIGLSVAEEQVEQAFKGRRAGNGVLVQMNREELIRFAVDSIAAWAIEARVHSIGGLVVSLAGAQASQNGAGATISASGSPRTNSESDTRTT